MFQNTISAVAAAVVLSAVGCATFSTSQTSRVDITDGDGKLAINIAGQPFAEYHYRDVPRPFMYPVLGASGEILTRHWPMKDVPGEEHDHVHHRSLWYAHGNVNGQDFWAENARMAKIVHREFPEVKSGKTAGSFTEKNDWIGHDGSLVLSETRQIRIQQLLTGERFLDFDITFHAVNGDVTFGDTKEGSMALRLAETMRVKQPRNRPGEGHIVNSEGVRDTEAWGKRAKWCDYHGPVNGKIFGVAIFDHPSNPRHPTWWHVRDYGLFAANPFGVHDFESKAPGAGDFALPAGQSVTFRYRIYFHQGDEQQGQVEQHYNDYASGSAN